MKHTVRALALGGGAALMLASLTASVQAETVLKFSTYTPAQNFVYKNVYIPMMREIEAKSNGEIKFEAYPGSALGKMPEQYDLVKSGLADISTYIPSYSRGRFPLTEAGSLPFAFETSDQGTMSLNAVTQKWLGAEHKGVKLLLLWTPVPAAFLTKGVAIEKIADLKDLKMRSAGAVANDVLKLVGSNVLTVPLPELYTALERGVVNGSIMDPVTAVAYKLYEPADHFTNLSFSSVVAAVGMNTRSWEKLTPEQQKIVMEASATAATRVGPIYAEKRREAYEVMRKDNFTMLEFSADEKKKFADMVVPLWDKWVEKLEDEGIQAKAFMADFKAAIAKHAAMKQASN
ncbi:MAG: TRAP transporter substrate-binding protein [Alphaproteobacteria bacterium]